MKSDETICKLCKNVMCLHKNDSVSYMEYSQKTTFDGTDNDETLDYNSRTLSNDVYDQKPDISYNNHQTPTIIEKEDSKIMIPTNLQPLPKEIQISPVEDPKKDTGEISCDGKKSSREYSTELFGTTQFIGFENRYMKVLRRVVCVEEQKDVNYYNVFTRLKTEYDEIVTSLNLKSYSDSSKVTVESWLTECMLILLRLRVDFDLMIILFTSDKASLPQASSVLINHLSRSTPLEYLQQEIEKQSQAQITIHLLNELRQALKKGSRSVFKCVEKSLYIFKYVWALNMYVCRYLMERLFKLA